MKESLLYPLVPFFCCLSFPLFLLFSLRSEHLLDWNESVYVLQVSPQPCKQTIFNWVEFFFTAHCANVAFGLFRRDFGKISEQKILVFLEILHFVLILSVLFFRVIFVGEYAFEKLSSFDCLLVLKAMHFGEMILWVFEDRLSHRILQSDSLLVAVVTPYILLIDSGEIVIDEWIRSLPVDTAS